MLHMMLQSLRARRSEIQEIAAKHGVFRIRVFGSVARGEDRPDSDVDFLVDAGPVTSSWFPAGLILAWMVTTSYAISIMATVTRPPATAHSAAAKSPNV